jgi:hypothetical protein
MFKHKPTSKESTEQATRFLAQLSKRGSWVSVLLRMAALKVKAYN